MEPLLFDASLLQRLFDAADLSGALKILGETNYSRGMTEGGERYDTALESELLATFDEFVSFVPDRELVDIFRVPYDFHNVKVLLKSLFKARTGGRKRWDLLTKLGAIPVDDLTVRIESEDYVLLPYNLSGVLPACLAAWDQTGNIVEVEKLLDRAMFASILELAEAVGEPGVVRWARARIDSENIRNLLRIKRFGFDFAEAATFLHEGGTVAAAVLVSLLPEPFESWGRSIAYTGVGAAISDLQNDGDFDSLMTSLERVLDDYCSSAVRNARFSPNAPENVLAYLWGKEMEIKNIRTILVSKGTGSKRGGTREMTRNGY
jgi:V/A-type H+-transporting ATPase subunit C